MDGRIYAFLLTLPLAGLCAGCVTPTQKVATGASSTNFAGLSDSPPITRREEGPKRAPKPSTEIAYGQMKEMEAESEALKKQPEAQARLRDDARQAYQKAIKLDPDNLDAQRHLGRLYTKIGDYDRAFELYRQAMIKHPGDARLWYDLGLCHNRRKNSADAARCFHKALELEPENREYMKKLGFTLAWLGHFDQGLIYLTRSQGLALAHFNIARIHVQKDQPAEATRHLQIALQQNSQLQEARELLTSLQGPARVGALGRPSNGG